MADISIKVDRFEPATYDVSKFYFDGLNVAMILPPNVTQMRLNIPKNHEIKIERQFKLNLQDSYLWNNQSYCKSIPFQNILQNRSFT